MSGLFEFLISDLLTVSFAVAVIGAATPLLLAATGELIVERSGVLNLGVEGMMLAGALAGFAASQELSYAVGIPAAALAGALLALIFAFFSQTLLTNQVATGLALTIFGIGITKLIGEPYTGTPLEPMAPLFSESLQQIPVIGPIVFGHDPFVYLSVIGIVGTWFFLFRTRAGLILRAVGEDHSSAHALGCHVVRIRYAAILVGGAFAGLGGAYMSMVKTPQWNEGMTAGSGWIALALIVFATWRPMRLWLGAYLFGALLVLQLRIQGTGVSVGVTYFLTMVPYLATILVLVIMSWDKVALRRHAPASIGKIFKPAS